MKYLILLVLSCVSVGAADLTSSELPQEVNLRPPFEQIYALIDVDAIMSALNATDLKTCESYNKTREYLDSVKFDTIHNYIWNDPEFLDVIKFLSESGFPEIYELANQLFEILQLSYRVGASGPTTFKLDFIPIHGSDICNEKELGKLFETAVPAEDVAELALELMYADPSVKALIAKLSEPSKAESYGRIKNLPEIQELIQMARDDGVEIDVLLTVIEVMLGYN